MSEYLMCLWDGGGSVPPELSIAKALLGRGHEVRALADVVLHDELRAAGVEPVPWTSAPQRTDPDPRQALARDWEPRTPGGKLAAPVDEVWCGPAERFAADVRAELRRRPADAVVTCGFLTGALIGARAHGVPVAALQPQPFCGPGMGVPPFGPGWRPRSDAVGRLRDRLGWRMTSRMLDRGLPAVNAAREANGLPPVPGVGMALGDADRVLVLTSRAFEYPSYSPPPHVLVTGPRLDDPAWAGDWRPPAGDAPLVLVGLSSTYMAQEALLQRAVDALGRLPVRGLVTTGPAVDPASVRAPANVTVVRGAPHAAVLREAAAVVTHGGHGTVIKAMAAGVPALVLPMWRDQHEIAARVVFHGAGRRLRAGAGAGRIAASVRALLDDPSHRAAARRLAAAIEAERAQDRAVEELEALAAQRAPAVA